LAANALTGAADPQHGYETYQGGHLDQRPPYLTHGFGGPCMQKPVHALPMMRVMSGATLNHEFDNQMMDAIVRNIDENGLWWLKVEGAPWRAEAFKVDFVNVSAMGRFMVALADWYRYDRDSRWAFLLERTSHGLASIVVQQGGTMYYDSFLRSGWPGPTTSPLENRVAWAKRNMGYKRPGVNFSPLENPQIYVNGLALRGFTRWYALSGDKKALSIAEGLAKYMQSPAIDTWIAQEDPTMVAVSEHAHWDGHFHSHTMGMIGLIEYANQVNDVQTKRFVKRFYEYSRNFGIARIGFFPGFVGPVTEVRERSHTNGFPDEGCALADMILLVILLSDGGVGDYWDDVDQYVRNHLIEHQLLSRELIEDVVSAGLEHVVDRSKESDDRVIDRQLGAFASAADPTMAECSWTMCCLGNCSVALYKAWESIIRCHDGVAQVNLLINRASPWLDIDSYLPYEGKVILKNKTARKAYVRLPAWVNREAVRCRLSQADLLVHWLNNYLVVERFWLVQIRL
jgi:hypothetical protein